jgi:hypothetical protein
MSLDEIEARLAAHNVAISTLNETLADVVGKLHHQRIAALIKTFESSDWKSIEYQKWLVEELRDVFAESLEATKVVEKLP